MGDDESSIGRAPALTLTWGGVGLAFAAVFPLLSNAAFVLPWIDISWIYANPPVAQGVPAIALIAACIVLAVGVRGEPGIAGTSLLGKLALILFGVTHTLSAGYFVWPAPGAGAPLPMLVIWSSLVWAIDLLSLVALAVAAIVVFRAGVLRGPARWGLPAFAVAMVVALLVSTLPVVVLVPVWVGALIASQAIQLATGVLYIVEGQRARHGNGLRVASA
ncbi:hypothetical protein KNO15_19715 [Leifsonia shinshuensis]|uniref:hypothetical protein n=1 Tax=Leifsonia shinshuensis TaxID=150026 RepID=UPI001F51315E|nr:hypothetical protein [Leifsonia shinshuensis]MCI0158936.1 hypothetical protein [Leifsonia shinshuensis]